MGFLSLNWIVGALSAGIMSGLALTAVVVTRFALHSHVVILNIYPNGNADWVMDATPFLKSLFVLMFVTFAIGLALGILVTRRK